jgi:DNA-binding transcriptional LysR family regulator
MAASPGYLTKFGIPGSISELSNHRCLGLGNAVTTGTTWRVFDEGTITNLSCQFSLSTNSNYSLMQTACLDNGIVYLPELCISNELAEERLIRILPGSTDPEPYGVFAVYPHRNAAAKVRVLVDFIEQHLCSMADTDRSDQMLDHSLSASGASVIQEDARQLI